jgi:hypothetical protein
MSVVKRGWINGKDFHPPTQGRTMHNLVRRLHELGLWPGPCTGRGCRGCPRLPRRYKYRAVVGLIDARLTELGEQHRELVQRLRRVLAKKQQVISKKTRRIVRLKRKLKKERAGV